MNGKLVALVLFTLLLLPIMVDASTNTRPSVRYTQGNVKVLVLLGNIEGTAPSVTTTQIQNAINTVKNNYAGYSYGKMNIEFNPSTDIKTVNVDLDLPLYQNVAQVFVSWNNLDKKMRELFWCSLGANGITQIVASQAFKTGVLTPTQASEYEHVIVIVPYAYWNNPDGSKCSSAPGFGSRGTSEIINPSTDRGYEMGTITGADTLLLSGNTLNHEFSHVIGLWHSHGLVCSGATTDSPVTANCIYQANAQPGGGVGIGFISEAGSPPASSPSRYQQTFTADAQGTQTYFGSKLVYLKYLNTGNMGSASATSVQSYTLTPIQNTPTSTSENKVVKITKQIPCTLSSCPSIRHYYYVEYRSDGKVYVYAGNDGGMAETSTDTIDVNSFLVKGYTAGQLFRDTITGVDVLVESISNGQAVVKVGPAGSLNSGSSSGGIGFDLTQANPSPNPVKPGSNIIYQAQWTQTNTNAKVFRVCASNSVTSTGSCTGTSICESGATTSTIAACSDTASLSEGTYTRYGFTCLTGSGTCTPAKTITITVSYGLNPTPTATPTPTPTPTATPTPTPTATPTPTITISEAMVFPTNIQGGRLAAITAAWTSSGRTRIKVCDSTVLNGVNCAGTTICSGQLNSNGLGFCYKTAPTTPGTYTYYAYACTGSACSSPKTITMKVN
ncbi:hypothetical protein HUU53_00970 [Candidatus Micrarchaeota archaeon]|nr:hypothetical protein [Candidatus Micrarchaeota archaeon]